MGRYGEIWGGMGRYGEVWGDVGRLRGLRRQKARARRNQVTTCACEGWGDMGRYGEIWGGMGGGTRSPPAPVRDGEIWGDMGRYGEIWEEEPGHHLRL